MSIRTQPYRPGRYLPLLAIVLATGPASHAALAQNTASEAEARYHADVKHCHEQTTQDVRDCLREAGAALYEARRGQLVTGTPSYVDNQRARCETLSGEAREDCLRLMENAGARVSGSVEGGGILREMTITIPAPIAH